MIEGRTLDVESFSERKTQSAYPYVELLDINMTLPLVLSFLEKGEVQIIAEYKGKRRVVGVMSKSAYNMNKLIKTQGRVVYHKSESEAAEISSVVDYLEVV